MTEIELVIKISKEKFDVIQSDLYHNFPSEMKAWGLESIRNGTPLPKGHGDLIDSKKLQNNINAENLKSPKDISMIQAIRKWIANQKPIIEAEFTMKEVSV